MMRLLVSSKSSLLPILFLLAQAPVELIATGSNGGLNLLRIHIWDHRNVAIVYRFLPVPEAGTGCAKSWTGIRRKTGLN